MKRVIRGLVNTDNLYAIEKNSEAGLLNQSSCLAQTLGVTKILKVKSERYDFGHTLLCCLSWTWMFNKPTSEAGLSNKSLCLAPALGVTKFIIVTDIILVTLCCAT
jgi:hypothetical protein